MIDICSTEAHIDFLRITIANIRTQIFEKTLTLFKAFYYE